MFESFSYMLERGLLVTFILMLAMTRLAIKHPKTSGGFAKGILDLMFRK